MFALLLLLAQASPDAGAQIDASRILDEAVRAGDLMIVGTGGGETGDSMSVLEAQINGCVVAFKTEIRATGFTARFIELGEGSQIEAVHNNRIHLRSAPELDGELILRSDRSADDILRALESTRSSCQADGRIF